MLQTDAPAPAEKVPRAQGVAAVAVVVPTKLPAGAKVQAVAPVLALKLPMAQAVCDAAPAIATKLPADAGRQVAALVAPTVAE